MHRVEQRKVPSGDILPGDPPFQLTPLFSGEGRGHLAARSSGSEIIWGGHLAR